MNALYTNAAIDYIQNAKITFLNNFVKEDAFRQPALDFVSAQTVFTKAVASSIDQFTKAVTSYDYKNLFNVSK